MTYLGRPTILTRPSTLERPPRGAGRRDWSTVVCFSFGKLGHAASQCPALDVTFPFLLPGWQAEKVGGGFVMQSPGCWLGDSGRKTATDPGRGINRPDQ